MRCVDRGSNGFPLWQLAPNSDAYKRRGRPLPCPLRTLGRFFVPLRADCLGASRSWAAPRTSPHGFQPWQANGEIVTSWVAMTRARRRSSPRIHVRRERLHVAVRRLRGSASCARVPLRNGVLLASMPSPGGSEGVANPAASCECAANRSSIHDRRVHAVVVTPLNGCEPLRRARRRLPLPMLYRTRPDRQTSDGSPRQNAAWN